VHLARTPFPVRARRLGAMSTSISCSLSPREAEVVRLLVEGLTDQEIGNRMFITERTAQAHVAAARRKLGARTRTHLAVIALRRGIVPIHPEE
jgi:DNA-binding CsgD family transcriptional regulator